MRVLIPSQLSNEPTNPDERLSFNNLQFSMIDHEKKKYTYRIWDKSNNLSVF